MDSDQLSKQVHEILDDDKLFMLILGLFVMFLGYMLARVLGPVARWRWFFGTLMMFTGAFFIFSRE